MTFLLFGYSTAQLGEQVCKNISQIDTENIQIIIAGIIISGHVTRHVSDATFGFPHLMVACDYILLP